MIMHLIRKYSFVSVQLSFADILALERKAAILYLSTRYSVKYNDFMNQNIPPPQITVQL